MSKNESFKCDKCKCDFYIGGGFLGSFEDFEFQIDRNTIKEQDFLECSPFMNYIQLCTPCYNLKLKE
jgi:hypothetical protein